MISDLLFLYVEWNHSCYSIGMTIVAYAKIVVSYEKSN